MNSVYIELAKAVSPHGIKGGITLKLYNPHDTILAENLEVLIRPASDSSELPAEGKKVKIAKIQFGNKAIINLEGHGDRTQIEKWLPFTISVERSHFPKAQQDEYYLADLMGLEVFNSKGKRVGKITGTFNHGSVDIIEIALNNGGELTLPFKEPFFEMIDLANKKVIIGDIEYL